ncbi:RloB family protein [Bacteroides intestinalis]|uniref:RloB family protein n=1 Tax=uncultured Duncaniella sp. TaxID=2768039 RepID=UPI000FFEADA7|nr:RloB family protein [Bacteroides intestinalis]RXE60831.1 RloB domain-containing protein [Muribaculaceae bacterium Isolate-004 (NCI)]
MRKRKDFVRLEGVRSARLVVIAGEGRYTESIYFNAVKNELRAPNVHVEVLDRNSDESSPESVHRQVADFMRQYNIEDDDELWLVIDRDRWQERMLSQVAQLCAQNSHLHFCMSNPCFELWLLLHLEDVEQYDDETKNALLLNKKNKSGVTWLKKRMKDLLGSYAESNYDALSLIPYTSVAMDRARRLDNNPQDRWPQSIGSRVYLLMESITGQRPE